MSRKNWIPVTVVSFMALALAGLWIGAVESDLLSVFPRNNSVINYPAFPSEGGPHIIAATYWPDGNGGPPAPEVVVIFNEPLDVGDPPVASDFEATFDLSGATIFVGGGPLQTVVYMQDVVGFVDDGTEQIRLSAPGVITGTDGSLSRHTGWITFRSGPAIARILVLSGMQDDDPNNDVFNVYFDHDVNAATVSAADFENTPVFADLDPTTPDLDVQVVTPPDNVVQIQRDAGADDDWRKIRTTVSKLLLEPNAIQYDSDAINNSQQQWFPIPNRLGPNLRAAYYNANDEEMWVVFDKPIDPTSIAPDDFNTHFTASGFTVAPLSGLVENGFPGSFSSVLKITNMDFGLVPDPPVEGDGLIYDRNMTDYQGIGSAAPQPTATINAGVGILRAFWDDKRTASVADDEIVVYLSETVTVPANIDTTDFEKRGFFFGPGVTLTYDELAGLGRITFRNLMGLLIEGAQIRGAGGNNIIGADSGGSLAEYGWMLIEDEARPWQVQCVEDPLTTYDRWDAGAELDTMCLGWDETGTDDGDQYLVFVAKGDPSSTVMDVDWANNNIGGAIPVGDSRSMVLDNDDLPGLLNDASNQVCFLVDPNLNGPLGLYPYIQETSDGQDIEVGDQLWFMLAEVDMSGNTQYIEQTGGDAIIFGAFVVGPLCPPRDYISDTSFPAETDSTAWDHDVIHVVADSLPGTGTIYYVYGDPGAVPCEADSVRVYLDHVGDLPTGSLLASGPVNPVDGSFDPIMLNPDGQPLYNMAAVLAPTLYIWAVNNGDLSQDPDGVGPLHGYATTENYAGPGGEGGIPFDQYKPSIVLGAGGMRPYDAWNTFRIYNDQDYVNIRLRASGIIDLEGDEVADSTGNALLSLWADFTQVDTREGNITNFSTPADSIWLVSMGADQIDNDMDWDETLHDVGLDGLPGTTDPGEGDMLPTFGDPYVDENGNGMYDQGETFLDVVNAAPDQQGVFNPGEPLLDSQDSDEFGWYEIRSDLANLNDRGDIRQGFQIMDPVTKITDSFAELFDVPVPLHIEDNGIGTVYDDSPPDPEENRSLEQFATFNGGDPFRRFALELDDVVPSVSEFGTLELGGAGGTDLIEPGNPTYHLGRFINFKINTLSDVDVLDVQMQVWTPGGGWEGISTDFFGGGLYEDVGADSEPGLAGVSDDNLLLSTMPGYEAPATPGLESFFEDDGFDNDEDGVIDEEGEGVDMQDPDVVDAGQTSETDDAVPPLDGFHSENDYIDNDNDAFFVYDAYNGTITWYNIDERQETFVGSGFDDDIDDDNDGDTDEADENPEGENYDPKYDNDEDGLMGGQKVAVMVGAGTNMVLARDPGYNGPIYVDAAHVMGDRGLVGGAANNSHYYSNGVTYIEAVPEGFENLTVSDRSGGTTPWGTLGLLGDPANADSTSAMMFDWNVIQGADLDLQLVTNLFGLVADGVTEYKLRGVAYDQPGNVDPSYSVPITFTVDLTPPEAVIPGCDDVGDPPADFADVDDDADGVQVYDAGKHPDTYTLEATSDEDTDKVKFQESRDGGLTWGWGGVVDAFAVDNDAPWTTEWPAEGRMYTVDNYPAANADTVLFRALAEDQFGNAQPEEEACILQVVVIDGTNPTTWLTQLMWPGGFDNDLTDGATVPQDSTIDIFASIADNDSVDVDTDGDPGNGPEVRVPLSWVGGLDVRPGDRTVNDDGSGVVDGDVIADTDGYPNDIREWPGGVPDMPDGEWGWPTTDDYVTNDIYKVVFEYRVVPDGDWIQIDTITGTIITDGDGNPQTVDFTEPVKITWDTTDLPTGDYDLRAWSCDIEQNCDTDEAQITTITIVAEGLRAYIQEIENGVPLTVHALHYIHDYEIKRVDFQYYYDADGNECWDDGGDWVTWDIVGDDGAEAKGDVVLYYGMGGTAYDVSGSATMDLTPGGGPAGWYGYVDGDGDGYSARDPVVEDIDGDGTYSAGDRVAIGAPSFGDPLTYYDTGDDVRDYYVDLDTSGNLTDLDWILRYNRLQDPPNAVADLWTTMWDPTGLADGNYLLRAVATDETGARDFEDRLCTDPEPIPVVVYEWDTTPPEIALDKIVLPDLSEIDLGGLPVAPPFVPGSNPFVKLVAEVLGDDVEDVLFEYRIPPSMTWMPLDLNDDDDFYANLDGVQGFQASDGDECTLDDEIFNDLNGNFMYDGPETDFVRSAGDNDVVDTPLGWPLLPLISEEDPGVDPDDDGDGVVDEDTSTDPEDTAAPWFVYIPMYMWDLATDTNIILKATATDDAGLVGTDEDAVIFGENAGPETDVVEATTGDGDDVDVWPITSDGDDVDILDSSVSTLNLLVTAEDVTAIDYVDIMYRVAICGADCEDPPSVEDLEWMSASDAGLTVIDDTYPYTFEIDISTLGDDIYEFYPKGVDNNGNFTLPPVNPYAFKRFLNVDTDFAFVSDPETGTEVAEGDQLVILGDLIDDTDAENIVVEFYFAPRILGEIVDPSMVSPTPPHDWTLQHTVLDPTVGDHAIVISKNDVLLEQGVDYTVAGDVVTFTVRPETEDVVVIDYNFTVDGSGWLQIQSGDWEPPYSVEWSATDGGVPLRSNPQGSGYDWTDADAYDLAAKALFDVNGDGSINECDYMETLASEGTYIVFKDVTRPEVIVYGLTRDITMPYPDMNWPGNPLFVSEAGNIENKLSGEETDVFIVANDTDGGSGIASVVLGVTGGESGLEDEGWEVEATLWDQPYIDIPITMYPQDYWYTEPNETRVDPDQIENVRLVVYEGYLPTTGGGGFIRNFEMELQPDGSYRADGRFDTGTVHNYTFLIDLVGDTQVEVADARNYGDVKDKGVQPVTSILAVPETPFYYVHIENREPATMLYENGAHTAVVTVTDNEGNAGTNLNAHTPGGGDPQGPIMFIWDPIPPVTTNVWSATDVTNATDPIEVYAEIHDLEGDPGVITVDHVLFEYTPDGVDWITWFTDDDPSDGWSAMFSPLVAPDMDHYDNDGDGLFDEEDEATSVYTIRVAPEDEAQNTSFSDQQDPPVTLDITVDGTLPMVYVTAPEDGFLFQIGDMVHISADATDDGGIAYVQFKYKDGRHAWQDTDGNGYYTSGVDAVWNESDPLQDPPNFWPPDGDVAVWGNPVEDGDGFWWFDIDNTPFDNGDDPWDAVAPYEVDWNSAELWWDEMDTYVHIGAEAVDLVDNSKLDYVLTVASDEVGPKAYIGWINDETIGAGEVKPVMGTIQVFGTVLDPDHTAFVTLKYTDTALGGEPVPIGIDQSPFTADPPGPPTNDGTHFVVELDTDMLAEAEFQLWAFATDEDGNEDDSPLSVTIRVDRTPPLANYTPIPPDYDGFTTTADYFGGMVIKPDMDTGDVMFIFTTTFDDVTTAALQFHYASDPAGLWRSDAELLLNPGMFDYEPNLNFESEGATHHVWRYHVENWVDEVIANNGPAIFRALLTDEAGNTNALQTEWVELTIDTVAPYVWNWEDNVPTDQVSVGDVVTFDIALKDATSEVTEANLEYRAVGDVDWIPGGILDITGQDVGSENAQWVASIDWTAPMVYIDTPFEFRLQAWDSAMNLGLLMHPDPEFTITVEDDIAPDNTKIVHVSAETWKTDDSADGTSDAADPLANDNWFIDLNDDGDFDAGTDYVISEGASPGVETGGWMFSIGSDMNTWPRFLDESYLTSGEEPGRVASDVVIVARTWADDESIDTGIGFVTFVVKNVATGEEHVIGKDEYAPFFPLYTWQVVWNTLELDGNGDRVYPDGEYEAWAWAVDSEGNEEDVTDIEKVRLYVDNEEPLATMDADATTETVETTATVERNSNFLLFARTTTDDEDDFVEFWYKRSRDQNVSESWRMIDPDWVFGDPTDNDGNPDYTRPFSFDLDLSLTPDPIDEEPNPDELDPLVVGESYDFAAAAFDILGNGDSQTSAFDDSRHITLTVVDNIAPVACITAAQIARDDLSDYLIQNPDSIHARAFDYIQAVNFDNDLDIDYVEFLYRKAGSGDNWALIDADITEVGDAPSPTWQINDWDLQALEHNAWYEVVSVATDDVGNSDFDPDTNMPIGCEPILVYVDYELPEFVWYHPTPEATTICDYELTDGGSDMDFRVLDVCIQVPTQGEASNDIWDVIWEWKRAGEPVTEYRTDGLDGDWLHDDILNTYCTTWLLNDYKEELPTGIYDLRVTVIDFAGNVAMSELKGLVYDDRGPTVDITNIQDAGVDDPTQDDIDFGQVTEIKEGTSVKVFATASDDELDLPRGRETHVTQISFRVWGNGFPTRDLGTIQFDPEDWGDDTDVEAFVVWNTTGLPEGTYNLQAEAMDECGNVGYSSSVDVVITDTEPPTARIACFDPDLEQHGNDPKTFVWIYAIAESDPDITDVLFQYDIVGDDPDLGWVNIGIATQEDDDTGEDPEDTQELYRVRIESSAFEAGTQMVMRALAKDSDGNWYGACDEDNPDENCAPVPTLLVTVVEEIDGRYVFEPVKPDEEVIVSADLVAYPKGNEEAQFVITVTTAVADQFPRLLLISEKQDEGAGGSELNQVIATLERSVDDPFVWRATFDNADLQTGENGYRHCGPISWCVTGLTEELEIDGEHGTIPFVQSWPDLGTNGWVSIAAYDSLGASVMIPPQGQEPSDGCLVLAKGDCPTLSHDESMYVTTVANTSYYMQLLSGDGPFATGYEAEACIYYADADVEAAQEGNLDESLLTVRRWNDDGEITGASISNVRVDPDENKVCFTVSDLTKDTGWGLEPIFCLVVADDDAPVFVAQICPNSSHAGRWNYTDDDPTWGVFLRDPTGQGIDPLSVEVLLTMGPDEANQEWVTVAFILGESGDGGSDGGTDGGENWYAWVLGDECDSYLNLERANDDGTLYYIEYNHPSCYPYELTEGWHQFNVRYKTYGTNEWVELQGHGSPFENFYVDVTPPEVLFVSGFVQNPLLSNVAGYFNPWADDAQDMLTAWVWDEGAGVAFMKSDETSCGEEDEFRYDLWLIDREDDQRDVDEIEERVLLHTGTPAELIPFTVPHIDDYNPGTDTLMVRLPIVGDSIIGDGDVIEVTLYSKKKIEQNGEGPSGGCTIDTIMVGTDQILVYGVDCHWDPDGEEMHIYTDGIDDEVGNGYLSGGSHHDGFNAVEARFIVDLKGPTATFNMPPRFDPEDGITIDVSLDDSGSGVEEASCKLIGPDGEEIEMDLTMENGHITGHVDGPLPTGNYTYICTVTDRVGNTSVIRHEFSVESAILTMTQAFSYPNPFNPAETNATISFTLSKAAEVTIKVYDFAGDYVTTLASREMFGATQNGIEWGGEAADGTDLANGAYICRITATDGARTEEANVKVVVWRE